MAAIKNDLPDWCALSDQELLDINTLRTIDVACRSDVNWMDRMYRLYNSAFVPLTHATDDVRDHFVFVCAHSIAPMAYVLARKFGESLLHRDDGVPINWRTVLFGTYRHQMTLTMMRSLLYVGVPLDLDGDGLFEFLFSGTFVPFRANTDTVQSFVFLLAAADIMPRFVDMRSVGLLCSSYSYIANAIIASASTETVANIGRLLTGRKEDFDNELLLRATVLGYTTRAVCPPDLLTKCDEQFYYTSKIQPMIFEFEQTCLEMAKDTWMNVWRERCTMRACALAWLDFPVLVTIEIFDAFVPAIVRKYLPYHVKWAMFKAIKDKICIREGRIRAK